MTFRFPGEKEHKSIVATPCLQRGVYILVSEVTDQRKCVLMMSELIVLAMPLRQRKKAGPLLCNVYMTSLSS